MRSIQLILDSAETYSKRMAKCLLWFASGAAICFAISILATYMKGGKDVSTRPKMVASDLAHTLSLPSVQTPVIDGAPRVVNETPLKVRFVSNRSKLIGSSREFGWHRDKLDGELVLLLQISTAEAKQMQEKRLEHVTNLPKELQGKFSKVALRIGREELAREPPLDSMPLKQLTSSSNLSSFQIDGEVASSFLDTLRSGNRLGASERLADELLNAAGEIDDADVASLRNSVEEEFDDQLAQQEAKIKSLQKKLEAAEQAIEERKSHQEEIVARRVRALLKKVGPLDWGFEPDLSP